MNLNWKVVCMVMVWWAVHCVAPNPKWILSPSDVTGGTSQISKAGVVSTLTTYQVYHAYDGQLHDYVSFTTSGLVGGDVIIRRPTGTAGKFYTSDIIRFGVNTVNFDQPSNRDVKAPAAPRKLAPLSLVVDPPAYVPLPASSSSTLNIEISDHQHDDGFINNYYINSVWDADYILHDDDADATTNQVETRHVSSLSSTLTIEEAVANLPSIPSSMPHILPRILSIAMPALDEKQTQRFHPSVTITGVFGFFWFSLRPGSVAFSNSLPNSNSNVFITGSASTGSFSYSPTGSMPGAVPGVDITYDFSSAIQQPCTLNNGGCASTATCSNAPLNCGSAQACAQVCTCPPGSQAGPFAGGVLGGVCASYLRTCVVGAPSSSSLSCSPNGALHCQGAPPKCYINRCTQQAHNCTATQTCIPNFDTWICSG